MNVIFDIGNVLIRWNLYAGFDDVFDTPAAMEAYLAKVGFHDWNREQDRGRRWADAAADLRSRLGKDAEPAAQYGERHDRTVTEPIEGSWDLVQRLADAGHALYALTNWSAETFPNARKMHPRLAIFRDIVVSGDEGRIKPDPELYRILLNRNGLNPADCVFIDDSLPNVIAARDLGIDAIHFTTPEDLGRDLMARGLLN